MKLLLCILISIQAFSGSGYAQSLDKRLIKHINANPTTFKDGFFKTTSKSLYPVTMAVPATQLITGLARHDRKLKTEAIWITGVFAANVVLTRIVKYAVDRKRPFETVPGVVTRDGKPAGKSFPSGHASTAFCTAAWLALKYKKWYVAAPAFLWAGTVSYSRMYLGVHYPSDVLAGAVIGIGVAWAGYQLQQKRQKRLQEKQSQTALLW